ncbi:adenine nucleotide alpha hydrolases-like protein [Lophium mytilinum]|uniref:Adenine nucleotide alpha hydrolases-like protein n=1 Tax=Lophium mytilinum TaxID=390894 RepID=A0A6A6R869_9PEZI|nr:adenine nucleotide alpha hydrolases-like protein [Lophium mytilinum]
MGKSPTPSPTSAPVGALKASSQAAAVPAAPTQLPVSPLLRPALGDETHDARRPSIQFIPHIQVGLPQGLPKAGRLQRRMSSPPPPPLFQPRVSFDTFDRPADFIEENSFTLITKHKDYEYTKRSRTFLCGLDSNDYSEYALQWLIDELVDDGDEIVCLRVVELDSKVAADSSIETGKYRKEAELLMKHIQTKNEDNKAINLILEFSLGKVNKVIDEMINLYEPAILVVGTRGRSLGGFQGLLPGSVSKYCLQHSPVPVIVVRPSTKRDKAKQKRKADGRHAYKDILDKAAPTTGHILNMNHRNSFIEEENLPASDDEAGAVAAAIGYKPPRETVHPLAHVQTAPGSLDSPELRSEHEGDFSPDDFRDQGVVMKSPHLQNLESPPLSDVSSSDDENGPEGGVPMDPEDSPDESAKPAASKAAERTSAEFVEPDDTPTTI